ncbi:hypothetical protein UCRNP2_4543 [Neofusicoccum parvum UCRNP2]|uniref:Uncharacterized protein n=1 Tax=Botryosphaeria parva (strain UCR-NP2) TaxID=1287680 RepID=R1EMC0_BOTPV|nr:hypothetical protein UCRNP2_4543 [Neofusicoccum parvum UCRNP2]
MSSEGKPGNSAAGDGAVNLASTALVVYGPPSTELTSSESLADVVKATTKIRDNTCGLIDLLEDSIRGGNLLSNEETDEVLGLIRSQLDELYTMGMAVKDHTHTSLREMQKRCGKELQRQTAHYIGQEQHLQHTIAVQRGTIETTQSNLSHLTLNTGLLRGENHALCNENYILRQKFEQLDSSKKDLEDLSKTLSMNVGKCQHEKYLMGEQKKKEIEQLNGDFNKQKAALEREKKEYKMIIDDMKKEHKSEKQKMSEALRKQVADSKKTINDIKVRNEDLKVKTEKMVEAAAQNIEQRCSALEDAKELRAKYLALQEAEKKAQEELRTELKEMKKREMNAIENLQKASAKVEELQKELKAKKLAFDDLTADFNEVKEHSEYFARIAQEASARELETLAAMERMQMEGQ